MPIQRSKMFQSIQKVVLFILFVFLCRGCQFLNHWMGMNRFHLPTDATMTADFHLHQDKFQELQAKLSREPMGFFVVAETNQPAEIPQETGRPAQDGITKGNEYRPLLLACGLESVGNTGESYSGVYSRQTLFYAHTAMVEDWEADKGYIHTTVPPTPCVNSTDHFTPNHLPNWHGRPVAYTALGDGWYIYLSFSHREVESSNDTND
jgi:hypothetical protein